MSSKSDSSENETESDSSMSEESPVYLENLEHIHDIAELEKLTSQNVNVIFDAECVRKRSNWSKSSTEYKFDTPAFNPKKLLESIPTHSPKLNALLSKIESLDKSDMKKHGKLFKHFIFSDIKSSSFGAKLIAGALIAKGFKLGYNASIKNAVPAVQETVVEEPVVQETVVQEPALQEPANVSGGAPTKPKQYGKIELLSDEELAKTPGNNFYLLASIGVYDQPISVKQKKAILQKMNQRPENINGELARIIVMDSGFKEGIDLFDIKYIHIFEPQVTAADQKQVIGRGTRTCGQKGLEFHPTRGWPLHVFIYDVDMPEPIRKYMANSSTAFDLYLKALNIDVRLIEFTHDLERATIFGSVDYELNKNIHSFSIARGEEEEESSVSTKSTNVKPPIVSSLPVSSLPQVVPENSVVQPSTNYSSLRSTVSSLGSESPIVPETNAMSSTENDSVTSENTQETPSNVSVEPENTQETSSSVSVEPENTQETSSSVSVEPENTQETPSSVSVEPENTQETPSNVSPESENTQETPSNVSPLESENTSFLSRAASIGNSVLSNIRSSFGSTQENKNTPISNETQSTLGGGPKLIVRRDLPILNLPSQYDELTFDNKRMTHSQLRKHIRDNFGEYSWDNVKMENLCKGGASHGIKYTPTQDFIRHYFTPENPVKGMLLWQSVGTGKCHAKDTPIMMYDGSIKMVQDIIVGDILMGDNSTPRKVLSLAQGKDELYDIIPVKGDKYTVNSEHILCLKPTRLGIRYSEKNKNLPYTAPYINSKTWKVIAKSFTTQEEANLYLDEIHNNENIMEIPVCDYLKLPKYLKKDLKGYRTSVDFSSKDVVFDPYIIGFWLGDGSKRDPVISTQDSKVLQYLFQELPKHNLSLNYQSGYDYRISSATNRGENKMLKALQTYNLINNKHIPTDYKINDMNVRLQLLAGLIDSDGYNDNNGYEITQKNKTLAEDILFLCRSLGFAAYMKECKKSCMYKGEKKTGNYYRIIISGDLCIVPVKIDRKRAYARLQKKNVLVTGIDVKSVGIGDYYGFTLDGNNRYLLGDFTVTHNTCSAIAAATTSFVPKGYTILWVTRTTLKNDIWKNMFDQICNEQIKEEIKKGVTLPAEHAKRMRMLSKEWSIRPMSYKQFSNLVSKQNNFYKSVVKKNGEADPLRKTLLIIDEAHKLYGGGDLSSLERPDMNALKQSIQQSFQLSGKDSVKLLLMTATPITENPMELIQLINLCKPEQEQMPELFSDFSNIYLDEHGRFTPSGETRYLNDIAGYVSYLNREKDARQFAQPIVKFVTAPIVNNMDALNRFDKNYVRHHLDSNVVELKDRVKENLNKLEGDLSDLDMSKFNGLNVACDQYEGKVKKSCEKLVNKNVKLLLAEAKTEVKNIRDTIKDIREEIKNKNLYKNETLKGISENLENNPQEYAKFKDSLYYNLKSKCGKTVRTNDDLKEAIQIHPVIVDLNQQINEYNTRIAGMHEQLKTNLVVYKKRILQIRELMKTDLSPLEKNVLRMALRDERKKMNRMTRRAEKENTENINVINKTRKAAEKRLQKKTGQLRKTLKERLKEENQYERENKKAEKQIRKTLRKQGIIQNIENEMLQELFNKYSAIINEELKRLKESMEEDEREEQMKLQQKEDKKKAKEDEKKNKAAAKEQERLTKRVEKEREKAAKKAERERLRETKRAEKMEKKNKTIKKKS